VWDSEDGEVILECITCGWKIHLKEVEKKEETKK
jgi:Zn ribbon nucleic-acid-binding protein